MNKPICTADECADTRRGRQIYCDRHYRKNLRYGDPLAGGTHYKTPAESFAARTTRIDGCLIWTGGWSVESSGGRRYGIIAIGDGKEQLAHRYAWQVANGPIPDGMEVDHTCHTTLCADADHLRLATAKQNHENRSGVDAKNKSSGVRGVSWDKSRKKWLAYVGHNGKLINLGRFEDLSEAGEVARQARLRLFTHNVLDRV